MAGLYGHRWTSAFGADPNSVGGREWALTLAGLDRAQINTGLNACRNTLDYWPPPAPVFKARCLGIPTLDAYRLEATKRESPFARLAATALDWYAFARADHREAERMLRSAYDLTAQRVLSGEPMPEQLAELTKETPKPKPITPGRGDAALVDLRELLKGVGELVKGGSDEA